MILPAGSPLVQFEITNRAHGCLGQTAIGAIMWVDRNPKAANSDEFDCGKAVFRVYMREDGKPFLRFDMTPFDEETWPAVCPCMGRFIE